MQITVEQVMARRPAAIFEQSTIDEAVDRLLAEGTTELYVTDSMGHLLGVVPDYELLKVQLSQTAGQGLISSLMSRSMLTTEPQCAVSSLAPAFRESFCRKAAVVKNGLLLGQIDRRDVLRAMRGPSAKRTECEAPSCGTANVAAVGEQSTAAPAIRGPRFLQNARCTADCGDESEF